MIVTVRNDSFDNALLDRPSRHRQCNIFDVMCKTEGVGNGNGFKREFCRNMARFDGVLWIRLIQRDEDDHEKGVDCLHSNDISTRSVGRREIRTTTGTRIEPRTMSVIVPNSVSAVVTLLAG